MEQGTIVYLCEDLFCKFRELFDWMKSDKNPMKPDVKSKFIENRFTLMYRFGTIAIISVFDDIFDQDICGNLPSRKIEQFDIANQYISKEKTLITSGDIRNLSLHCNTARFVPVKRKGFIFEVPLDKLTRIEKL